MQVIKVRKSISEWCHDVNKKKLADIGNKKYVKHSWKKKIYCTDQGIHWVQWIRKRPQIVNKITVSTSTVTVSYKSGNTVLTPWRPSSLLISESFFDGTVVIVMAMKGNNKTHTHKRSVAKSKTFIVRVERWYWHLSSFQ